MKSTENILPGFDNITAKQEGEHTLVLSAPDHPQKPSVSICLNDYDSPQEFLTECRWWAKRHGGVAVPQ